jgi:putative nucleotidyltransferase with HDIG domain
VLLITDRVEQSGALQRMLALWGPCTVLDVTRDADRAFNSQRMVVSNVELSNRGAVESVRAALSKCRQAGTPYVCLLNDPSPRATIQANAIGATSILRASTPARELLAAISRILDGDEASDAPDGPAKVRRHFVAATAALADMLDAAANGGTLPMRAIDAGVDSINQAADKADLGAWLDVVWNHDDLTYQHCLLVAGLAAAFARQLGFSPDDRKLLTCAAVLHDIGKARISLDILHKPGKLAPDEWEVMRGHPAFGHEMLVKSGGFAPQVVEAVRSHHEYLDGSGYPDGLRGEQIPDVVRIITICDVYAALIERRSYRPPMPPEEAYAILREMGPKLDAALLHAFRQVVLPENRARAAA